MTGSEIYEAIKLTVPEVLGFLKDLTTSVVSVVGIYIAFRGLSAWKRQINGQSDHNLSKNLLISIFKYRDAMNTLRNPFMSSQEMPQPTIDEKKGMSTDEIIFHGTYKAYQARWQKLTEAHAQVYANLIEAEALWGKELKNSWRAVVTLEKKVIIALNDYLRHVDPKSPHHVRNSVNNDWTRSTDLLFNQGDDDKFLEQMEKEINAIETYIRKRIGD